MRFFRWYWQLTKKAFNRKNPEEWREEIHSFFTDFWCTLKWAVVTVFCLTVIIVTTNFLWGSLPQSAQEFLAGIWFFIVFYAIYFAKAVWSALDPVKPFFVWLWSLNWHDGTQKVQRILLHIIIVMFTIPFTVLILLTIADFIKLVLSGTLFDKKGLAVNIISLVFLPLQFLSVTTLRHQAMA